MDDSFGCSLEDNRKFYAPYNKSFPRPQTLLLELWDELGIPHKLKKQVFGPTIPVIGINVDACELKFTMTEESRKKLCDELEVWCGKKRKERLKRWYQMGGWFNWALNAHPLLRPALNNFYPKLRGRKDSGNQIWVNDSIREDFQWALDKFNDSSATFLLESLSWTLGEATIVAYCDACPAGMGFWFPGSNDSFHAPTPSHENPDLIFYFEALCVLSAIFEAHHRVQEGSRIVVYTDNSNTVDIFNSLRCLPPYNHLLKSAVDILITGNHSLRVLHVAGVENGVADALSRSDFDRALSLNPALRISPFEPWNWIYRNGRKSTFEPPRMTLGAMVI